MKKYLKKVVYCTKNQPWKIEDEEGILYIADSRKDLHVIKEMGMPVIAWCHEGNRDQNLSAAAYAVEDPEEVDMEFYENVYRREKGIPWEILETEHCLVREMMPEDAYAFEKIYQEPEISRFMKDFHGDAAGEAAYIREYQQQYRFYEYGVWSIVLKSTGEVIGRVGFSEVQPEFADMAKAEWLCLGYMIGMPWQGQGLAYEVCKAILEYAREELFFEKVQLFVEEHNEASKRLSDKLGFAKAGSQIRRNGCQVLWKMLSL